MKLPECKRSLANQRRINRILIARLRAETGLSAALSALVYLPSQQSVSAMRKLQKAVAEKDALSQKIHSDRAA